MQIERKYKPELATLGDGTRFALRNCYLENKTIIATDGHILAVVPVTMTEGDGLECGYIPNEIVVAARKRPKKWVIDPVIAFKDNMVTVFSDPQVSVKPSENVHFPDYKQIVKKAVDIHKESKAVVTLDINKLSNLAKALGTEVITLNIASPTDVVFINKDQEAYGLIMPVVK